MVTTPILFHVNLFESKFLEANCSLETMFRKTRDYGADGIELRLNQGRFGGPDYWESLLAAQEKYPQQVLSFGTILNLTSPDEDVRRVSIDDWVRALEFLAPRLPFTVLNVLTGRLEDANVSSSIYEKHGSHLQTDEIQQAQIVGLKEAVARTETLGVRLAMETHQGFLHDLALPAATLAEAVNSKRLGVLLDYGNMIGFQPIPDLEETIRTLGKRITSLHLKNSFLTGTRPPVRCGLGDGAINHHTYLQIVREQTETMPPLTIEFPRAGDREYFAKQDLAYLRDLLETLDKD